MVSLATNSQELERVRYWQGQMLRSGDFRRQLATDSQLRAWHNRSLHSAYGVALGLEASIVAETGATMGVQVQPGIAYDCFGRPLILATKRVVTLPANTTENPTPITLSVKYREDPELQNPRDAEGVCVSCGPSACAQFTEFTWQYSAPGIGIEGVPLARIIYNDGKAAFDSSFTLPGARPLAKPYLANGSTIPGGTPWQPWQVGTTGNEFSIGLQTVVDTSSAGFTQTPCYFAWLEGTDSWFAQIEQSFPLFTSVSGALPGQFTFNVFASFEQFSILARRSFKWPMYVCWLGCQPQGDWSLCLEPEKSRPCCS